MQRAWRDKGAQAVTTVPSSVNRLFVLAVLLPAFAAGSACAAEPTVRLTIDYGDGVEKTFVALAWREKLTVFDAMQAAAQHPRGIKIQHTGSGETIFVTAIDDRTNEGQGGNNWRYEINGQRPPQSAGVAELKAGDAVLWRFGR
jgi:uncharacterized protein DUF4430